MHRKNRFRFGIVLLLLCSSIISYAQPFKADIDAFKKADELKPPPNHAILFIGSSSFTKWTDVGKYFPGYTIINRGFGGSTIPDVNRYANDIIFPYHPKQIVIYCGENDMASSEAVTPEVVLNRFQQLLQTIRAKLPEVPVLYISMKPSPSRFGIINKIKAGNSLINHFIGAQQQVQFVNVFDEMLQADGHPKPGLFIEDNLHMNAKGYDIWKKIILPYLLKD